MIVPWKKSYDKPRQCIKKQRHHFANKGLYSQSCGFSSSHVWMWELDLKEGWALKNWRFQTVVLEKTLESPLDSKEIKPVHPKGNQPSIFIGRTDQFSSVPQSCLTLCDPMNLSTPGLPVHHQLPESTQTHVHWVGDAIQPSHPLSCPSLPAFNVAQDQWVSSSHQVAKVLELQHQSFQWIFKTDFL